MKNFTRYLLVLLFSIGCSSHSSQLADEISFDPNTNDIIQLSAFVEDVEFVNLEFSRESMIENIDCAYYFEDKYIIADKRNAVIMIFDNKGKFLSKINRKGRARNEYLSLDEVRFDEKNGQIIIYDAKLEKFLYYTLDGNCTKICEIKGKNDRFFTDIINLPNGNFLCYSYIHGNASGQPKTDGVCEMTAEGEIIKWYWTSELVHPTQTPNYTLSYNPQGELSILCLEMDADMVFENEEVKIVADYKPQGNVAADFSGISNAEYSGWLNGEYFNSRFYACNMGQYIFSRWWGNKRGSEYYTLYDTRNNKIIVGREVDYQLANGKSVLPGHIFPKSKQARILPAVSNLKDVVIVPISHSVLFSEKYTMQTKAILGEISPEESNPVLQIWRLKKF